MLIRLPAGIADSPLVIYISQVDFKFPVTTYRELTVFPQITADSFRPHQDPAILCAD